MKTRQLLATFLASMILLATTAGVGLGLVWYKGYQTALTKNKKPPDEVPEAVSYDVVSELDYQQSTSVIGTIVAPRWMNLRTESSGRVVAVHITSGQEVQEGETLIELDASVEQASKKAAEAKLKMAESSMARLNGLDGRGAVSSQELEQSQFDMASAKAEKERLEAIIAKRTMIAPYKARVGLINVSEGQYLTEGVELTTLTGIEKETVDGEDCEYFYVDFAVPQYVARFIEVGQTARVKTLESSLNATILAVDARSDRQTRNLMVRAKFTAPSTRVSANDSVNVVVDYGPKIKATVIPAAALLRSPTGSYVYIIAKDAKGIDRVTPRLVKSTSSIDNKVVITEGLSVDERIVSQGAFKLRPGLAVREAQKSQNVAEATGSAGTDSTEQGEARR